jgi:hypothetical protein
MLNPPARRVDRQIRYDVSAPHTLAVTRARPAAVETVSRLEIAT